MIADGLCDEYISMTLSPMTMILYGLHFSPLTSHAARTVHTISPIVRASFSVRKTHLHPRFKSYSCESSHTFSHCKISHFSRRKIER